MPLVPDIDPARIDWTTVEARRHAVAEAVNRIRVIESTQGVTRDALEEIQKVLLELAGEAWLFDVDQFPEVDADTPARLYVLNEDAGGRFALYLTCAIPGGAVPPHNHSTWAVVAGLRGDEENRIYERTDGGTGPGEASIREARRKLVHGGEGIAMMPDDIHSVHTPGSEPRRHFHMYGMSLENLPDRLVYDTEAGRCEHMPANPKIVRLEHA